MVDVYYLDTSALVKKYMTETGSPTGVRAEKFWETMF